jgi:argininosuccinate synthase
MTAPAHGERVVLAYDGTSAATEAISSLAAQGLEVVTLTLDVGQGDELLGIRERALASGAVRAHVLDAREEFAREFILPLLHAGDTSRDPARAGAEAAATLIRHKLLDVRRMESAGSIVHGETPASTLIGRYVESNDASDEAFALTRQRDDCPREPAFVSIDVEGGVPVRENGIDMSLVEMLDSLETIGGAHGIGRREGTTPTGRWYYSEAPAATVLLTVFAALGGTNGSVRLRLLNGECIVLASERPGRRVGQSPTQATEK